MLCRDFPLIDSDSTTGTPSSSSFAECLLNFTWYPLLGAANDSVLLATGALPVTLLLLPVDAVLQHWCAGKSGASAHRPVPWWRLLCHDGHASSGTCTCTIVLGTTAPCITITVGCPWEACCIMMVSKMSACQLKHHCDSNGSSSSGFIARSCSVEQEGWAVFHGCI